MSVAVLGKQTHWSSQSKAQGWSKCLLEAGCRGWDRGETGGELQGHSLSELEKAERCPLSRQGD